MRKVGSVADKATDIEAPVILEPEMEDFVARDDLLLIKSGDREVLTRVCRVTGRDESLRIGRYSPGIALVRKGVIPSSAKRFSYADTYVLGIVDRKSGKLKPNKHQVKTGKEVFVFEEGENPMSLIYPPDLTIGHHPSHQEWRIPINPKYISYHISIVGTTGSGKSFLVIYELVPCLRKAGYSILIIDWKGEYAPFYESLPLLRKHGEREINFSFKGRTFRLSVPSFEFDGSLLSMPEIIDLTNKYGCLVIDEKTTGVSECREFMLSLGKFLYDLMAFGQKPKIALIIEEGPQYFPYRQRADKLQKKLINIFSKLCALGRSHDLSVTVISQGMAGEIGIDSSIRRNLNNHFIGNIHPLDFDECKRLLGPFKVDAEILLSLLDRYGPGYFYFHGPMNPSPSPLLLHFQIR